MRLGPGRRLVLLSVAAAALVVLIPSAAAASGGQTMSSAQMTLTVTLAGTGTGWVTSTTTTTSTTQQGISCGTICSAQFLVGTGIDLKAQSATGSTFAGFSTLSGSDCFPGYSHGGVVGNHCTADLEADTVVQVAFNTKPPPCIVLGLKGKTLANAKRFIKEPPLQGREDHPCLVPGR